MLTGVPGSAPASTWPGGQVPDTVAERVRLGVAQVGLVVEAEEPCPGGEVGGDVRCEGPSLLTCQVLEGRLRRPMALAVRTPSVSTVAWSRWSASMNCWCWLPGTRAGEISEHVAFKPLSFKRPLVGYIVGVPIDHRA